MLVCNQSDYLVFPFVESSMVPFQKTQGMLHCRPQPDGKFSIAGIFSVSEDKFARWATTHFRLLVESCRRTDDWLTSVPCLAKWIRL